MAGKRGLALLFPGQGAQSVGMGRALIAGDYSSELLAVALSAGLDLASLLVDGDAEALRPTQVAQPALYYTGVALARVLLAEGVLPEFAAGHSLGEYCALAVAGAIDAELGMSLVLERGRLMAGAADGTMAAVLGLSSDVLEPICEGVSTSGQICVVANDNCPGQLVISGTRDGVERAGAAARAAGARRIVPLNVGGAFHSPLMAAAAAAFAAVLTEVEISEPLFPVACGATGALTQSAAGIREGLTRQLDSPVLWTQAVQAMIQSGAGRFVECGPGNTLASLVRRIATGVEVIGIDSPEAALASAPRLRSFGEQQ
ncbi:MAG: ACP S-malonyltransferase [Candidatus Dormibacteria bacterium]